MGEVDYFAFSERSAIVDYYDTAATVAVIFYVNVGAEWKSTVGGCIEMLF